MRNRNSVLMHYLVAPQLFNDKNQLIDEVTKEFHKCLLKMNVTSDLFIIDPYFYSSTLNEDLDEKIEKANFFISMFKLCLESIERLVIIFSNKIDQEFKTLLHTEINKINPNLQISCYRSNKFHDRFVFNPLLINGISLGASFNGLLKKINKFDSMSTEEAIVLEKTLQVEKFL
ncbi:hypothetical protein [Acinetobacter bereziniae]|uniref:hypothetical protein n=1 Tax=Acinetobacter bereziniae TaxID=106648 RepID=UPI0030092D20